MDGHQSSKSDMKMIRNWGKESYREKLSVVHAPAPPGCEGRTRVVPVTVETSDDSNTVSSDDDESLSTLYEAEEEPLDIKEPDEELDDDDIIIDSTTSSSTLTVIHRKDDSLDDIDDIIETPKNVSMTSVATIGSKERTRVTRRLPEESSFIGTFIRGKLKAIHKPEITKRQRLATGREDVTLVRRSSSAKAEYAMYKEEEFTSSQKDETSSLNTSRSSLSSGFLSMTPRPPHFVVVAIDFGTTYSGYAFSFVHQPESVHLMRKWSGGDPGITNQKTPTVVLLRPSGEFHSFGFEARDFYHDLDANEAKKWIYLDRFKMKLHCDQTLSKATQLEAANGTLVPALKVFAHALRFFRHHALQELSDELGTRMRSNDVRWVVTVPAIWRPQAKQFMRQAAYQAGLATEHYPEQLVIALEPEAASIFCRKSRFTQLQNPMNDDVTVEDTLTIGSQYMVVDCGGGTVDVTIHEVLGGAGLKEVEAASGDAMGSVSVDREFENLLKKIFGEKFISTFQRKRPIGWVDMMIAWESRKRSTTPDRTSPLNVALPFSFIDLHRKIRGFSVETAIRNLSDSNIKWSPQGMLRISSSLMQDLFAPTLNAITTHVTSHLNKTISHIFLVGGFVDSPMLQRAVRNAVGNRVKVIIPPDASLTILKGAVLFGLDPTAVRMRTSHMTYGVGVLNRYVTALHPTSKMLTRGSDVWCKDVFDAYVKSGDVIALGDVVQRSYAPVRPNQTEIVINFYSCPRPKIQFIDEHDVIKCATLRIKLPVAHAMPPMRRRELRISMMFGDTEIKIDCVDVTTGSRADARADFLS
ncbi:unnamed protein product [Clavelina lepadiformis]|uniref:Heat shock 70 kDa protein 12A n=1 Tax=Clavelina lepadiformis TaxID=159417 RepID=A0ABP0H3K0_CLALP